MNWFIDNWYILLAIIAAVVVVVIFLVKFFKGDFEKQLNKVREWLLYATSLAEKELGSGTGQLKLRQVYDMFVVRFPWIAKLLSFERFSILVDEALESMNKLLDTNNAVKEFVNGPAEEEIKI